MVVFTSVCFCFFPGACSVLLVPLHCKRPVALSLLHATSGRAGQEVASRPTEDTHSWLVLTSRSTLSRPPSAPLSQAPPPLLQCSPGLVDSVPGLPITALG